MTLQDGCTLEKFDKCITINAVIIIASQPPYSSTFKLLLAAQQASGLVIAKELIASSGAVVKRDSDLKFPSHFKISTNSRVLLSQ